MQVNDTVEVDEGSHEFQCSRCGKSLGPITGNYKLSALVEEMPVTAANPLVREPERHVDEPMVWRRFYCPGCGVQLDTEIARAIDAPLWDIELA